MTLVTQQFTLAEYLTYGELVEMPPEWDFNSQIASYLFAEFLKFVSSRLLRCKGTKIVVGGVRATARVPNLIVFTEELLLALRQ